MYMYSMLLNVLVDLFSPVTSFLSGLSSTPYPSSTFKSIRRTRSHVPRSGSDLGSSPSLPSPLPETPLKVRASSPKDPGYYKYLLFLPTFFIRRMLCLRVLF